LAQFQQQKKIFLFYLETKQQIRIVDNKPEIKKSNGNLIEASASQKRPNQETRFTERPNQETKFTERPKFDTENVRIHSGGFPTDSIGSNDRQLSPGFSIVSTDAFDSESLDSAIGISPTVRRHHYEPLNKVGQNKLKENGGLQKK